MKLTKSPLRQIIEEEINALAEEEEGEGYMAVSQLEYMKEIIPKIQQYVNDASDLEEWVESKITLAHEYIETVYGHFEGTDKPKVNKYLNGLVVTVSSRTKPKQVREVFTVNSFKEAVNLAIARA